MEDEQGELFGPGWAETAVVVIPEQHAGATIQQRWAAFHVANPWVGEALRRLALDLVRRGRHRIGIGMLAEVVRWEHTRQTTDPSGFRLNNTYRAPYARWLMAVEPELVDAFETRRSQVDEEAAA